MNGLRYSKVRGITPEQWTTDVRVGDTISYHDVNLWFQRGELVEIKPGPHGCDYWVRWNNLQNILCPDLLSNLVAWKSEVTA